MAEDEHLTFPVADEHGRFLPGVDPLPPRRIAARMWAICALPDGEHHEELRQLVEEGERRGVYFSDKAAVGGAGCNPLHVVSILGKPRCAEILLNYRGHNADIDLADDFGNTALHAAACRGRAKVCELLLLAGANPNVHNQRGYTPLGAAVDAAHTECVALLLGHGAMPDPAQRPAQARREAKDARQPFHWDRGLAAQSWWQQHGMPRQSRRCRELDMCLAKHLLSACPDAKLLETPLDRLQRVERAHEKQRNKEMQRRQTAQQRSNEREQKMLAYREKIERHALRRSRQQANGSLIPGVDY